VWSRFPPVPEDLAEDEELIDCMMNLVVEGVMDHETAMSSQELAEELLDVNRADADVLYSDSGAR